MAATKCNSTNPLILYRPTCLKLKIINIFNIMWKLLKSFTFDCLRSFVVVNVWKCCFGKVFLLILHKKGLYQVLGPNLRQRLFFYTPNRGQLTLQFCLYLEHSPTLHTWRTLTNCLLSIGIPVFLCRGPQNYNRILLR